MSTAPWAEPDALPRGAIPAEQSQLLHDNTYGPRPRYYADRAFRCIDCDVDEIWTATQQKWWYEVAKGKIDSRANRCGACRRLRRMRSSQARRVHIEGMLAKYGIEDTAWRLKMDVGVLERMMATWQKSQ